MRIPQIIILCINCLFISCGTSVVPPTDNDMIQHFRVHEPAFNQIKNLISECPNNSYYPPYHPNDTTCLTEIPIPIQKELDSLLIEIGSKRIFYKVETENPEKNNVELCLQYFVSGYSVGGTTKEFVYSTTLGHQSQVIENRDLNDIYQERHNDTILYKPIKENWFIRLVHDN